MKKWAPLGAIIGAGLAGLLSVLLGGGGPELAVAPILLAMAGGAAGFLLVDQNIPGYLLARSPPPVAEAVDANGLQIDGNLIHSRRTYDHKKDPSGHETNEIIEHFRSGILQLKESGKTGAIQLSMHDGGKLVIDRVAEDFSQKGEGGGVVKVDRKWRTLKVPVPVELSVGNDEAQGIRKSLAQAARGSESFKAAVRRALESPSEETEQQVDEKADQSRPRAESSATGQNVKVFVANRIANPFAGTIGQPELDQKSMHRDQHVRVGIYLDADFRVVAVDQIWGEQAQDHRTVGIDGGMEVPNSAVYRVTGNSVPKDRGVFKVKSGQVKGVDGIFRDDSSWLRASSFKQFDVTVDDKGFIDLKSPDANARLKSAFNAMEAVSDRLLLSSPESQFDMKNAIQAARDPEYMPTAEMEQAITTGLRSVTRRGHRR